MNEIIVIYRCCLNSKNDIFVRNEMLKYSTTKALMTTINEIKKMKLFLMKARKDLMKTIEINEKKVCSMTQAFF